MYTVFIEAGRQLRILVELSLAYLALLIKPFSLKNSPRLEVGGPKNQRTSRIKLLLFTW